MVGQEVGLCTRLEQSQCERRGARRCEVDSELQPRCIGLANGQVFSVDFPRPRLFRRASSKAVELRYGAATGASIFQKKEVAGYRLLSCPAVDTARPL